MRPGVPVMGPRRFPLEAGNKNTFKESCDACNIVGSLGAETEIPRQE